MSAMTFQISDPAAKLKVGDVFTVKLPKKKFGRLADSWFEVTAIEPGKISCKPLAR